MGCLLQSEQSFIFLPFVFCSISYSTAMYLESIVITYITATYITKSIYIYIYIYGHSGTFIVAAALPENTDLKVPIFNQINITWSYHFNRFKISIYLYGSMVKECVIHIALPLEESITIMAKTAFTKSNIFMKIRFTARWYQICWDFMFSRTNCGLHLQDKVRKKSSSPSKNIIGFKAKNSSNDPLN